MGSFSIIFSAVFGALIAATAGPLVQKIYGSKKLPSFVFLIFFLGALALARLFIAPPLERMYLAYRLEDEYLKTPAFVALKEYEPAMFAQMMEDSREKVTSGAPALELRALNQKAIANLVVKRVPTASNTSAVAYMQANMNELKELHNKPGNLCFQVLFATGTVLLEQHVSPAAMQADLAALVDVLRAAKLEPQKIPTEADFVEALGPDGLTGIDQNFAEELTKLTQPKHTLREQRRACEATLALYDVLFSLPQPRSGIAIRYLASQM